MGGNSELESAPRTLAAEMLVQGVLLALGLGEMLSTYEFRAIVWPQLLVLLGLVILVVWVAQLLVSWERMFGRVDVTRLPLGGFFHLWVMVPYTGLVYLACKYHHHYRMVLTFVTLIGVLDLCGSMFHWRASLSPALRLVNRNWVVRDVQIIIPFLALGWALHMYIDGASSLPSLWSGAAFLVGMLSVYLSDMWWNRKFYGTEELWQTVGRLCSRCG